MVTISTKKKNLLRRGCVFNILFKIHEQMSITINKGCIIAKGCIVSKQILRTLRSNGLSSGLSLCVNIKLGKIKIRINFLGLTDSIVKAVRIRGPEIFQEGIGVMVFTDRPPLLDGVAPWHLLSFFPYSPGLFPTTPLFSQAPSWRSRTWQIFLSIPTFQALRPLSSSSVSLAFFLIRSNVISWFKHHPIRPFIITIAWK